MHTVAIQPKGFSSAIVFTQSSKSWNLIKSFTPTPAEELASKGSSVLYMDVTTSLANVDITTGELIDMMQGLPVALEELRAQCASTMPEAQRTSMVEATLPMEVTRLATMRPHIGKPVDHEPLDMVMYINESAYYFDKRAAYWFTPDQVEMAAGAVFSYAPALGTMEDSNKLTGDKLVMMLTDWLDSFTNINSDAARAVYTCSMMQ